MDVKGSIRKSEVFNQREKNKTKHVLKFFGLFSK
jgi:hypothetical protein